MVVDTLVAQIGKNKPKARPQTRGGSWKLRTQAKKLDKFLYGEFIRNRVYEKAKVCFRDACIFGLGALYCCVEDDKIYLERVFPDELIVDQMEVVSSGRARHYYRRRVLPAEVVASTFKQDGMSHDDFVQELESIARTTDYLEYRTVGMGYVVVVEGWQLSTEYGTGRYIAAVQNKILRDSEYKLDVPPFAIFNWQHPVNGFYSPSAVEQILPYQIRLTEINDVIRDAQDLMARPRVLIAEGSRVNPLEIDNMVARFIKYTGIKPEAITWPAISAELYNERDRQVRICLDQFGLSNLTSKAEVPQSARFDSAPAFRQFNAIQDDRLADPAQRYERFFLDIAELIIKTMHASGVNAKTTWFSSGGPRNRAQMEQIEWKDIDIDKEAYVLQLEATSIYDSTPSAIRDELEKQLGMGLITPEQYRLELGHPDDEAELSIQAAAAADIRRVIGLLEEGKYESPTPIQDLVQGVQLVSLAALNLKQYDDVDPEIEMNFINWITEARAILEIGMEPQQEPTPLSQSMPGLAPPQMPPMGPVGPMAPAQAPGPNAVPVPETMGLGPAKPN
jgi:hypothetical protein